jgi:hypothetical protein
MGTHHFTSQYSLPQNVTSHYGTSVTGTSHTWTLQNGTSLKNGRYKKVHCRTVLLQNEKSTLQKIVLPTFALS